MGFSKSLTVLATALLAACSAISSPPNTADLDGADWVLATLPGKRLIAGSVVTLSFADGRVSGTDGCNRYSGAYTASDLQLQFDASMATTMMACAEPLMEQAGAYMAALGQVRSYRIAAGQLILLSADDVLLASLAPLGQGVAGTAWTVKGYNNGRQAIVSVLADTTLTMAFSVDGKVSGSAGCNNYSASYTETESALDIGPAAATRKMCGDPAAIMQQEQQFLAALETVGSARREGGRLELRTVDGALAVSLMQDAAR